MKKIILTISILSTLNFLFLVYAYIFGHDLLRTADRWATMVYMTVLLGTGYLVLL